ncbi:hypothetical protein B0G81_2265 [Paraburkholderia sp. BL6665CI2N2]|uniref:hypothetical protein n=1 Tax=Paraburkholderia sp. BL6665CI2N2 TaxID=1938806 RepID=UPI001064638E|nr:hypothetical protein [Paraburkholderia sp. BL6665CI2N2]TDY22001.1 hypothetical protein B0G81_2265 [Paraburkholderia sp. BL6665CI2N2]
MLKEYDLRSDVLDTLIGSAAVSPRHDRLRSRLAERLSFDRIACVKSCAQYSPRPGRILDAKQREVAADFRAWLPGELEARGGDVESARSHFHQSGFALTEIRRVLHYFTHDRGGDQDDFVQFRVWEEQEFLAQEPFERKIWWRYGGVDDSEINAEYGPQRFAKVPLGPPGYRLHDAIDIKVFNLVANSWYAYERAVRSGTCINFSPIDVAVVCAVARESPRRDFYRCARDGQRFFDDWSQSSLASAGARVGSRWCFDILEYTDARNIRSLTFFPQWTHRQNISSIKKCTASDIRGLYARLQRFDERVGGPFSWFFYGLQGDLVKQMQMDLIGKGAQAGLIVLPPENRVILQRWMDQPYGF